MSEQVLGLIISAIVIIIIGAILFTSYQKNLEIQLKEEELEWDEIEIMLQPETQKPEEHGIEEVVEVVDEIEEVDETKEQIEEIEETEETDER